MTDRDLFDINSQRSASQAYRVSGAIYNGDLGSKGDSETSAEAAKMMKPLAGPLQALVLAMLEERKTAGLTPEEGASIAKISRCSIQPRFSELKARGLIVDSGQRRVNPSSRKRAVVWVLAEYAPKVESE